MEERRVVAKVRKSSISESVSTDRNYPGSVASSAFITVTERGSESHLFSHLPLEKPIVGPDS